VPDSRITLIPSGIERVDREPSARLETGPPPRRRCVGTLAAFTEQKDPRTWMNTALRLVKGRPDVDLVWWGEGPLRETLREQARRENLGTRIDLGGFQEVLDPFWRRCEVFFLPSKFEALGTVLLDAMARGIPIVASRVGGIPEVVRDGIEGKLVSPGDSKGFARAIEEILDDSVLAGSLGAAGRERARAFEIGTVVDRLEALYSNLSARGEMRAESRAT
jgi:glycosyltransferase involved in cell wall biosynthesis